MSNELRRRIIELERRNSYLQSELNDIVDNRVRLIRSLMNPPTVELGEDYYEVSISPIHIKNRFDPESAAVLRDPGPTRCLVMESLAEQLAHELMAQLEAPL